MCKDLADFEKCSVCRVFGVTADSIKLPEPNEDSEVMPTLTRLMVRDAMMTEETAQILEKADTDLLFTDVKTEVVIDRITSQATPRQIERVPAGSQFGFGMIFNIFVKEDSNFLKHVFQAMALLEDDSLGGQGSRGYGKIKFQIENVAWRPTKYYATGQGEIPHINARLNSAALIRDGFEQIQKQINA